MHHAERQSWHTHLASRCSAQGCTLGDHQGSEGDSSWHCKEVPVFFSLYDDPCLFCRSFSIYPACRKAGPEKPPVSRLLSKCSVHFLAVLCISWHSPLMDPSRDSHGDPQQQLQPLSPLHIPLKHKVNFREGHFQNWDGGMISNLVHAGSTSLCNCCLLQRWLNSPNYE